MTLSGGFWRTVCFSLTALFIFHLNKHIWIDLRGVLMFTLACITVSRCLHTHNNEDWPSSTSLFSLILLQIIFISLLRNTPTPVRLFWSLSLRCVCYECPLSRIVFLFFFVFLNLLLFLPLNKQQWGMQFSWCEYICNWICPHFCFLLNLTQSSMEIYLNLPVCPRNAKPDKVFQLNSVF